MRRIVAGLMGLSLIGGLTTARGQAFNDLAWQNAIGQFVAVSGLLASDNFNRADGPLAVGNWTLAPVADQATVNILTNRIIENVSDHSVDYWNANVFNSNQWSQATMFGSGQWNGLCARAGGLDLCYLGFIFNSKGEIYIRTNGVFSSLATEPGTIWVSGDVERFEVFNTYGGPVKLRLLRNGVQTLIVNDWGPRYITNGSPGIGFAGGPTQGVTIDDWSGGNTTNISATTFADDFNRPDEMLRDGPNWTVFNGSPALAITNNRVRASSESTTCQATFTGAPFTSDQYSQVVITNVAGEWLGPAVRMAANAAGVEATGYYALFYNLTTTYIRAYNGADQDLTNTTAVPFVAGDTMRLEVTGSNPVTLVVKRNGTTVMTWVDSTYKLTGGQPGLKIFSSGGESFDNWQGGNFP